MINIKVLKLELTDMHGCIVNFRLYGKCHISFNHYVIDNKLISLKQISFEL